MCTRVGRRQGERRCLVLMVGKCYAITGNSITSTVVGRAKLPFTGNINTGCYAVTISACRHIQKCIKMCSAAVDDPRLSMLFLATNHVHNKKTVFQFHANRRFVNCRSQSITTARCSISTKRRAPVPLFAPPLFTGLPPVCPLIISRFTAMQSRPCARIRLEKLRKGQRLSKTNRVENAEALCVV